MTYPGNLTRRTVAVVATRSNGVPDLVTDPEPIVAEVHHGLDTKGVLVQTYESAEVYGNPDGWKSVDADVFIYNEDIILVETTVEKQLKIVVIG